MFRYLIIGLLTAVVIFSFAPVRAEGNRLKDGEYKGKYSFVEVEVTIENGRISEIKMLEHGGGGKEYADMVEPLIDEIVREQSTEVDAVTGATISSDNLKKAVDEALKKAR